MTDTAAPTGTRSVAPLRRNRDFMLLWSGQVVSTIGTRVTSVAYPLLVLALTGSPAQAGIVGFAQTLPFLLLYLPAGALVDRWPRKRTMILCDIGRALALGSVAVTAVLGTVSVPQLVVVAFIEGSLFVFFDLCEGAALPHVVAAEQLPAAIAQNQARIQGADLVGQPLGGVLFSIGRAMPFAFDAATYAVSAIGVAFIRRPMQLERVGRGGRLRDDIAEGLRAVWAEPFIRAAVFVTAGLNFVSNALTLVLIVRAQELGAGPAAIGLMFAFFGGGAIVGSVVAPSVRSRFGPRQVLVTIVWFWVLGTATLAFVPNVLGLGVVAGLIAFGGPIFNVVLGSIVYERSPDRLLARIRSTIRLVAWGTIPLGALAAGFLAGGLGAVGSILVLAAVDLVVGIGATVAPGMRTLAR
jgi:MFS family permease